MAIDFDALDLVRGGNKARSYNTKLDGLQQQVTLLRELVTDVVKELPEEKKWSFRRKIKKNKRKALTGLPSCLICSSLTKGELHEQRESDSRNRAT